MNYNNVDLCYTVKVAKLSILQDDAINIVLFYLFRFFT